MRDAPGPDAPDRYASPLWQALKLGIVVLLAYAVWRGYQNPDLILDLAALRLC
ncbi:MAG: hypothetical protein ABIS17_02670 [Casimicrobiaceae bacterium]